jgi:dihydrofolate reductase
VSSVTTALIVAADEGELIGAGGSLPWHLPADLQRFKRLTTGHVVVAGRRTHESIVDRLGHPLPERITVVATRRPDLRSHDIVIYQPDVASALAVARAVERFAGGDTVFVIGGAEIYAATLPEVDQVYLTRVHGRYAGDVVMPAGWLEGFELVAREQPAALGGSPPFSYLTYRRR